MNKQFIWSSAASLGILFLATPLVQARNAHLVTVPVHTAQNANSNSATLPPGCPNYTGVLSAFGVPVGQELQLEVYSDPAPPGGYYWNVYSSDPTILAAGNTTQGFIPQVYTPEGSQYSSPFSVFGVAVGETSFVIQETSPGIGYSYTPSTAWAVNPGASSPFLDANPPSNTCLAAGTGVLSADPNVLSTCGSNVNGAVTDGVTQLLLRIVAGLQGTGCYSITSTAPPDQGSITSAIVSTQAAGSYDYGFSNYLAPNGYGAGDTSSSRQVQVQFAFAPAGSNTNTTIIPATLTVIRPPLLLIHGLWSSSAAWAAGVWGSGPNNLVYAADYQFTNAASFSVNYPTVQNWVASTLQQARVMGYAATQADVVGHSMGGDLTRLYAGSSQFIRNNNYNMGDVHRLVTLDTPHAGASLANLIVSLNANSLVAALGSFLWSDFASGIVGEVAVGGAGVVNDGAICDLSENSPALQGLKGGTNLPCQVVTGAGGIAGTPSSPAPYFPPVEGALTFKIPLLNTYLFPQNVVNGFRFLQQNDQIVSLVSQQALAGGGGSYQTNYIHTKVETWADVANQTFALLDGPGSNLFSSLPGVASNGLGNPVTVTGTTPAQDRSDYASECIGFFAPLASQSALAKSKEPASNQAVSAAQIRRSLQLGATPDSRIQITSPTNGQQFAPGNTVTVTVHVASPLTLSAGWVATLLPGVGAVNGINYTSNSFQASFVIPPTSTGPVTLTPSIIDASSNPYLGVAITINVVPVSTPTSLHVTQAFTALTSVPATASIVVTGTYPNGTQLNLTSSVTGTTYSSSNTNLLTVNAQGTVQAIAFGTALVTVQNSGLTAYAVYDIENPAAPLAPQNLTTGLQISQSGFRLNRNTGFYTQTVTITNNHSIPMVGPLYFVINGLPAGVNLANNGGGLTQKIGPVGSPYLRLSLADGLTLQPGAQVSLLLQFLDPTRVNPHYTPMVFRTLGTP